jgi:LytS/YehU family sensor histidine kinase
LNTLATIIIENPPLAVDFVQKLAEVYRYVLNVKDKQTVTLATEMECVEAFVFLLKIRYEDHFHVEIHLSDTSYSKHVPPVSLQMLVENAIKHNIISKGNPLKLSIYDNEDGYVVVENTFQPKILSGESTGIGLSNICSRYKYLTEQEVIIVQKEGYFKVKLPLLIV